MSILQLAIYAYIALVFFCLVLVTIGFVTRRVLGTRAHKKLMNDLKALTPRLKTLPSEQREVAGNLSSLILPIDHYGWSDGARKELQTAIDSIASEANRIDEKVKADRRKREKQFIEDTQNTIQQAAKAAAKAEDAARKAEDAANRALDLTRKAEEGAAREATAANIAQELSANATAKDAIVEKLEEGRGAKPKTVLESSAMTTLIAGGSLNSALATLPRLLFSHYFWLILRFSPVEQVLVGHRLAELRWKHHNESEFRSAAQELLEEMARTVEQRGLVAQEGEASEKS
jgi:hypothetical protein